jgi:hypothetical protein
MTQAIDALVSANRLAAKQRDELLQVLSMLADEAAKPKPERRVRAALALIADIAQIASSVVELAPVWISCAPLLEAHFLR